MLRCRVSVLLEIERGVAARSSFGRTILEIRSFGMIVLYRLPERNTLMIGAATAETGDEQERGRDSRHAGKKDWVAERRSGLFHFKTRNGCEVIPCGDIQLTKYTPAVSPVASKGTR